MRAAMRRGVPRAPGFAAGLGDAVPVTVLAVGAMGWLVAV